MASRRELVEALIEEYGAACYYCHRALDYGDITLDHYVPRAAGGPDELSNLRPSCFKCNNDKADRVPLPDGSLPPKQVRASIPKIGRPSICSNCQNGRLLRAGELCPLCQTGPQPPRRPRYLKKAPKECDHIDWWCSACCLWLAHERLALTAG